MRDLTELENWQIVEAEPPGFSRATKLRTITEFKKHGKNSSNRSNSGMTCCKRTYRNRHALVRTVGRKHRTTAAKVTTELYQHMNSQVSTKTVRCDLNKAGYHGRAAIREPLLSTVNIQKRLKWCYRDHSC